MSSSSSAATLMDEFQAFVTRVKQLHMSRSADADCDRNLSHDKARRRFEEIAASDGGGASAAICDNSEELTPPATALMAKSLDDQQLQRFNSSTDDIDMDSVVLEEGTGEDKIRVKKELAKGATRSETKEMKKNIQIMVGIDEDLKMILEMDPEIVDLGGVEKTTAEPKVMGLPPLSGR